MQLTRALAIALTVALCPLANGQDPVQIDPAGEPGDTVLIQPNGENHATGIWLQNLSQQAGEASVTISDGPLPTKQTLGSPYQTPFVMVDNTLLDVAVTGIPAGERLIRIRLGFGRADIRARGLRADTLHVMKLVNGRFIPAIFDIQNQRAGIRFFPDSAPIRQLGHFGIDQDAQFAWAVIDRNGTYGLAGVPEPAAMTLMLVGSALLLARRQRRVS